ncbi:hypothetical protein [Plasticicumulans sp.]|uniref:hypothetical protein n=1 Tax=Plasticicumulans sp. TaxID=2307179 RepID=UPI002B709B6E|nr:hypothetical protein [Plasticicumulans sp.]HNM43922.1 hypothetical protein [Plasticicumulans sp.]
MSDNTDNKSRPDHSLLIDEWKIIRDEIYRRGHDADCDAFKIMEVAANETTNRDFVNWKRVRSAIEHENHLVGQRITWLIAIQVSLLTAFSAMYVKWWQIKFCNGNDCNVISTSQPIPEWLVYINVPMYLVALLGIVICVNIYLSLLGAGDQVRSLTRWWYSDAYALLDKNDKAQAVNKYNERNQRHPRLHLRHETEKDFSAKTRWSFITRPFRSEFLPIYFAAIWALLLGGMTIPTKYPKIMELIREFLSQNGQYIVGGLVLLVIGVFVGIHISRKRSDKS